MNEVRYVDRFALDKDLIILRNIFNNKVPLDDSKDWQMPFLIEQYRRNLPCLRVRFFGKIRKRICDPRSYGFFDTKETQNPKKDYFAITRQAGGTQYICQNDISVVLPKNSTRMEYK